MIRKPILILGTQDVAQYALSIFASHDLVVYGFLAEDDSLTISEINDIPILGSLEDEKLLDLIGDSCDVFVAVAEGKREWVEHIKKKYKKMPLNAIHSTAYIDKHANIGHGNLINAQATLHSNSKVGNHTVIQSGVTLGWGCKIGDYVTIESGCIVDHKATVESGSFVGAGSTLIKNIMVEENAIIGAGSVVTQNVKENTMVFGNPAKKV